MDWAKLIAERAQTSAIIHSDQLAAELKIPATTARRALFRQQGRGLVENVANRFFVNRLALDFSGYELINLLRPESYLSLESVLRNSGISTQSPRDLTCVTTGEPGRFQTSTFSIRYRRIAPHLFWGFHPKRTRYGRYDIAEPEKALLDWIYLLRQEGSIVPTDELDLAPLDLAKLLQYSEKFPKPVRQQALELAATWKSGGIPPEQG
jgi:hypothetical protein